MNAAPGRRSWRVKSVTPWLLFAGLFVLAARPVLALQEQQHHPAAADGYASGMDAGHWFGIMELPFLLITIVFAFRTARALKGGAFGKGMAFMAWGFLVMAVGHLHMQVKHFMGHDLFAMTLGTQGGMVAWFIALVTTWLLSLLGFHYILKASHAA